MAEIQQMSIKHEAILNYLIVNPTEPLSQVAAKFGVTQPWLSCIIHSRAFQEQLVTRRDSVFNTVVLPLQEKLLAVAHSGVDKLHEAITVAQDAQFIADTTLGVLDRLGYSPKARGMGPQDAGVMNVQQNNYYMVDKETLANARANMGRRIEAPLEALPAP